MGYYVNTSDNVKIYVEDLNSDASKTIVFIHGWPGNHNLFEYQYDVLIKMGYRCIGIDCRGFGLSDRPTSGYDYDTLSDDIRTVVEALNLDDFTLLGHSTGGAICVRYMARHNGYGVSKLVLCAAAAPSLIERPYFPHGLPKQAVLNLINTAQNDRPTMLKDFGNMIFYKYVTEPLQDWIYKLGLDASGWGTIAIANTWLDEEKLFDDLKKIDVPTLILHSVHDKVCLFPLALAQHESIKDSKLVAFDDAGHFLFYDSKDKFNDELIKFTQN
jgi:non-heme chloroperoxidase